MSSPNPHIGLTTGAVTIQLQGEPGDLILLVATGTYGVGESCAVNIPTTNGALVAYQDQYLGTPVILGTGGKPTVVLPGGFLYTLVKSASIAPSGVDVQFKPRIGTH